MDRTRENHDYDRKDKETVIKEAQKRGGTFQMNRGADPCLWGDRDVVLAAVANAGHNLEYATLRLKADREIVMTAAQSNGYDALRFGHKRFRSDLELVLVAVGSSWKALELCSPQLVGNHPRIVRQAVEMDGRALEFAPGFFKSDRMTVLIAMRNANNRPRCHQGVWLLAKVSEALRGDREVVLTAIQGWGGEALACASEELQNDRDIVLAAVEDSGLALQSASPTLQGDREIVYKAIEKSGSAFQFASLELRGDRELLMMALRNGGEYMFWYASSELKGDRDLLLHLMAQDENYLRHDNYLQHALDSPELKADRGFVESAIRFAGRNDSLIRPSSIFGDACKELKADKEVLRIAILADSKALLFASEELQLDPDMVRLAFESMQKIYDYDLWVDFCSNDIQDVYIHNYAAILKELTMLHKADKVRFENPDSNLQFANRWLSEALEKKWLAGELMRSKRIPASVMDSSIFPITGVQDEVFASRKLLRCSTILCYVKKGLIYHCGVNRGRCKEEIGVNATRTWDNFVRYANWVLQGKIALRHRTN